ncbi:MAG: type IV secretion protein DotA, partial [Alphaproteobacteria bacterium]|nr:type IV secretion protein DotA [Alphaproteobacteria bacterium]
MARITAGNILKVAILPGIVPRTRELMAGGFGYIAFYIAQIFWAVKLLPTGHPYLSVANFGRFGISHVTSEAWRSVVKGQRHIDQIIIFCVILVGIAILFIQFCFLGAALFTQAAHALPPLPAGGFLGTANPDNDVAFVLLDYVFGIPSDGVNHFFGSCVAQEIQCFTDSPWPIPGPSFPFAYHDGLHAMLQVYSIGLLVIAMVIFSYFAVAILLETAESGTPFGRRFNALWAPVRMVMAIALLMPIANGLNAAQYVVLYAAKWGSGFATNGWNLFVADATAPANFSILGDPKDLVAAPSTPPVNTFVQFATVLAACKIAEASGTNPRDVNAYVVFPQTMGPAGRADLVGLSYADALDRSNNGDIYYVFGVYETDSSGQPLHANYPGQVKPVCGEVALQVTDVDDAFSPGSYYMLEQYH